MSDQDADTADPDAVRAFTLRETDDAESAYCERHDREMWAVDPVVHRDGALYTTGESFSVYTCPGCITEIDRLADDGDAGFEVFRRSLTAAFDAWTASGAREGGDGGWFRFIGEGRPEDADGDGAAFTLDASDRHDDRGGEA